MYAAREKYPTYPKLVVPEFAKMTYIGTAGVNHQWGALPWNDSRYFRRSFLRF